MNRIILLSMVLVFTGFQAFSQNTDSESTIDAKFQELITNSNNFKGYKVVDTGELTNLQQLTSRRIAELKEEIAASQETVREHQEEIEALKAEMAALESQLGQVTAEKDAITFLGMPFSKASYQSTMWGITGILVLALIFFVYRFKSSHLHTKEARARLAETEKEFESYRAKALEKEQRMGRELQDERNKAIKVAK